MQVRFSVGHATDEGALQSVRGSGFQRVRIHDLDGPGHSTVRIQECIELRTPASLRFVKETPELQLPDHGACDPCSLIQADVEAQLEVLDPAGLEGVADGVLESIDVERVEGAGGDPPEFGHQRQHPGLISTPD